MQSNKPSQPIARYNWQRFSQKEKTHNHKFTWFGKGVCGGVVVVVVVVVVDICE